MERLTARKSWWDAIGKNSNVNKQGLDASRASGG
jgi:hypothetical protein